MTLRPIDALIVVPLGLLCLLTLARLARLRPGLRPLVGPFALCAVVAVVIVFSGLPESPWLSLVYVLPLLMLVVRATSLLFQWVLQRRRGIAAPALLDSVVSVLLYGIGAAAIVHSWFGLELAPFLATSAVVGAVVGLALQDTLGNLFAGIALHSEAPIHVGDWVRMGDRVGRVEQVSWRAMRLLTWDGDTLTVPNNEVARHPLLNHSVPVTAHSRTIAIGVSYHTPPNRVIGALKTMLEQVEGLAATPASSVRIIAFAESSITYEIRYYFDRYEDSHRLEGEIHRLVWYHFRRVGIPIPFPARDVFVHRALRAAEAEETPAQRLERALRTVDLFRPLTDEELRRVMSRTRPLHYSAGERVIEEDRPGDSFFIIDQGTVRVSKKMAGANREIARLVDGQFFGEMALLTGERRSATIEAITDVDLFMIDKAAFQDILAANPTIAVDISTLLSERREALSQAADDLTAPITVPPGELRNDILGRIRAYFGL